MKRTWRIMMSLLAATTVFALGGGASVAAGAEFSRAYQYDPEVSKVSVGSKAVTSPVIHEDGTVTFTLAAPEANSVVLTNTTGGWTTDAWPQGPTIPMTKDADGNWTVTIGPLEPEFYNYAFIVDGVYALDPINPLVARDGVRYRSELPIAGEKTYNYEYHDVPHGTLAHVYVPYPTFGIQKRTTIYTPPAYENGTAQYPVVYLHHGGGGDEDAWTDLGRVPEIMDNLIAKGKIEPMIVVMSNIYSDEVASRDYIATVPPPGSRPDDMSFPKALVTDLIPFIDGTYRTLADAEHRAIVGLSRGGMMSFYAGLTNLDTFAWIGSLAGGFPNLPGAVKEIEPPANIDDLRGPDRTRSFDKDTVLKLFPMLNKDANDKIKLLYISVGAQDGLISAHHDLRDLLAAQGVNCEYIEEPGYGHEWAYWRVSYQDFVQKVFQPEAQ